MLTGHFDQAGRPRLDAFVTIPGLGFHRPIQFMVDTGSSSTSLNVDDVRGVDLSPLGIPQPVGRGYGGLLLGRRALGLVGFHDPDHGTSIYQVGMLLFDDPELDGLPSVLGRDILDHWLMTHDPTSHVLRFEVWRSDDFVPL